MCLLEQEPAYWGGVRIGDGASIGANAVVISDVPAFSVAVGVPAKIVKNKTNQEE